MNIDEKANFIYSDIAEYIKRGKTLLTRERIYNSIFKIQEKERCNMPRDNVEALSLFLDSKRIEGCSEKTLKYYKFILQIVLPKIDKLYYQITTEDIRFYLSKYRETKKVSKITIDNVRRIISTFFKWLENEDYIVKSPCTRIHKVRVGKVVKEVYSDEDIENIKSRIDKLRNLCIVEFLLSTGVRVGELVRLNKKDIDFENRECIVLGKGNKQRKVYFDVKTKIHLKEYLDTRKDLNDALFVSFEFPYNRLKISGVEIMLRRIGKDIGNIKVYPHKFRRTLATKAIDKGMPIEQVQRLLGHTKIDTTLEYALVDDMNVKNSHKKYLE